MFIMAVFLIIEIEVSEPGMYSEYVRRVPEIIEKHGGRYLVRGGKVTPLSGNWNPERIIVVEFETVEQIRSCLGSPEYLELAPLRERSTASRAIIVDGHSSS